MELYGIKRPWSHQKQRKYATTTFEIKPIFILSNNTGRTNRFYSIWNKTGHAFFLYTNFVLVQFKEVLYEKRGDH